MTAASTSGRQARSVEQMRDAVGRQVGVSDWVEVDQQRIDRFADLTNDHQYIHVDPERAAAGPFGGTIAHGFLSLSLLSEMAATGLPSIEGASTGLNYGFDKIRFLSPVRSGSRIRAVFTLTEMSARPGGQTLFRYQVEIAIEGAERPAAVAEWLILTVADEVENA